MKEWIPVYSKNKKKQGPGSEWQAEAGVRIPAERIVHAAFKGESQTVCGVDFSNDKIPETTAYLFPSCGSCYNKLRSLARWEMKSAPQSRGNTKISQIS